MVFRQLEGPLGHVLGFLKITRFQERNFHHSGKMSRFPFVDAGQGPRIITGDQDHSAPGPGTGQMKQKIRGHIDPVLLHDT